MTPEDAAAVPRWESLGLSVLSEAPAILTMPERLALFALVHAFRPHRSLEIGTARGGSALLICAALDAAGAEGALTCVDPEEFASITEDVWEKIKGRVTRVKGRSPDALPPGPFDFVFVDGDHSREAVLADLAAVLPLLYSRESVVLMHDALNSDVAGAIEEACRRGWRDCGLLSTVPHFQDGVTWGGLRLLRRQ